MLLTHKILLDFLNNRFEISALDSLTVENWETIVSEAGRHRIAPFLYHKIKQTRAESSIPSDVIRKLRKQYLATAYRNTILFHQLNEIVASLNSKNIPVMLLKGGHLAQFVYKEIALRPMSDIDILVKEEDLSETIRIAFDAGYCLLENDICEKDRDEKEHNYSIAPEVKHFNTLIHSKTKCILEIHCNITSEDSPFKISSSELWLNSQSVELKKKAVLILSPDDLIIHLCLHAAYDDLFGYGLGALYDIAVTIKYYDKRIDWQKLWHRSVGWRTDRCLGVSLYFVKKWFESSYPEEMLKSFRCDKMMNILEERIFRASKTSVLDHHFIHKRIRQKVREKIRHIHLALKPPRNCAENGYQQSKSSGSVLTTYFSRLCKAFKEILNILKSALHEEHFFLHLKRRDNDVLIRKWLAE